VFQALSPLKFYDAFTGPDGTNLIGHSADVGGGWSEDFGHFHIVSGRARVESLSGSPSKAQATADAGVSNFVLSGILNRSEAAAHAGFIFRCQDSSNFWLLDLISTGLWLIKVAAGAGSLVASESFNAPSGEDFVLEVVADGSSISCTVDGAAQVSAEDAAFQTATKIGLYAEGTLTTFDELQVIKL
jgi:hypothetical protein